MSTTRHPAIRIALFALVFRLASAVLAFLENVVFPLNQPQTFTMLGQTSPFWDTFTRYDSGWYYQVARNGYQFVVGGPARTSRFTRCSCAGSGASSVRARPTSIGVASSCRGRRSSLP